MSAPRLNRPVVVVGLPRSRTAWLARFLSPPGVSCIHEATASMASMGDLRAFLDKPDTGMADTMAALLHREILLARPDVRFLVVRRPIEQVVASIEAMGEKADRAKLGRIDLALDEICDSAGPFEVHFHELSRKATCARVFRYCLGRDLDDDWWNLWRDVNVQTPAAEVSRIVAVNLAGIGRIYGPKLA